MSCKKLFSRLTWIGLFIYAGTILIILLIIAITMLFTSPSIATSNNNSNKKQKNRYETINGKRYYISGEKFSLKMGFIKWIGLCLMNNILYLMMR